MIQTHIVIILKHLKTLHYDVALPVVPRAGDYVLEHESRDLGLKVHSIFISPARVTVRVMEEEEGDFDVDALKTLGWKELE